MGDVQLVTKTSLTLSQGPLSSEPPAFALPPRNVRVSLGGVARLDGKVRGYPEPQVMWYRNGKLVIAGDRYSMEQSARGAFCLVVRGVQEDDAGRYTCEAANDAGSRQVTVEITVEGRPGNKYSLPSSSRTAGGRLGVASVENRPSIWGESPPKFVTKPSRLFLKTGQTGKFSAKITGRPQPQVMWLRGDVELQDGGRLSMFEKSGIHFLEIRDVHTEDAGMYTCSVVNSAGKAMATAELIMQGSASESSIQRGVNLPVAVTPLPKTPEPLTIESASNGVLAEQKPGKAKERADTTGETRAPDAVEMRVEERTLETAPSPRPEPQRGAASPQRATSSITLKAISRPGPQLPGSAKVQRTGVGSVENQPAARAAQTPAESPQPPATAKRFGRESRLDASGSAPKLDAHPMSQDVSEGESVVFECKVSGSPAPAVSWTKDGRSLSAGAGIKMQQRGDAHLLSLEGVRKEQGGAYGCAANNSRGTASASWTLSVSSPKLEGRAPVFSSELEDCTVSEGQDFILQCTVEGEPVPQVNWLLNDKPVPYTHASFENGVAKLTVLDALPEDDGSYACVAENSLGRATCTARVTIKEKQRARRTEPSADLGVGKRPLAPVFLKGLKDLRVMDGSQVSMRVEVNGNPQPEIVWLHNGKEIQESEDFHFEQKGNEYSLLIQEVFPEDTGKYTCEVWNASGVARTESTLTVQEPQEGVQPWFITKPKSVTASLGQHVLLSCAIAGDPSPQFLWLKGGRVLSSGEEMEILQKEDVVSLLIRRMKPHHAGDYEIRLKNSVGDCSCVATLLVSQGNSELSSAEPCQIWEGADGTARDRGAACERIGRSSSAEDSGSSRGLLKRRAETKEHGEDQVRQQEAEQRDFRSLLSRKVVTKSVSEEDLKELNAEQMDFRANLQRQVKPKPLPEDERKGSSPQQVDFRAVLGKKAGAPSPKAGEAAKNPPTDFRAVLGNKKKPPPAAVENNGESPGPKATAGEKLKNDVNCVDGGIIDKKNNNIGKQPVFTQKLSDAAVLDGECLSLQCQVAADPQPTVTWTLDGKVVKASKFIVLSNEGGKCTLTIDKALPEDEGQYKCRAENAAGSAECDCMVLVDDPTDANMTPADKKTKKPSAPTTENEARIKKPSPKTTTKQVVPPQILQFPDDMKILAGEKVEILCKFGGALPISCTWLKFRKPIQNEQSNVSIETTDSSSKLSISPTTQDDCGCYTVELHNKFGTRQAALNLTIVDKPDPPARVPAASDIRRSTLTLSWYGPTYDGGSAVQSYNLEIWNSVDKEWKDLVSCNSTSYNVENLLPDRDYKFRVRAVNMYGVGEPSAESEPVRVGQEEQEEDEKEEAEVSDDEKEPEYRDVTIKKEQKVKDLYDVEERLGTGKFGQVFKLVEKATKKVWAGKFIKAYSAKEKENVRQEISIMNCLHHPKLVQCIDAFEGKSDIVMVLEMISGGELFERIIDEDFELTEREVIKYMLQIIDGVQFIHKQGIVHLDLKPENIMCINKTGGKIKLIDFGLARRLETSGSLKVLFGTPEFVAPEVINYEAISYPTDMWSIGVICYILVSGLSPFMGDNDNETLSNVTSATWDFEDEAFDEISDEAKDFISNLLKKDMRARLTCAQCFQHKWLKQDTNNMEAKKLSKERMKKYILRRKWQKTGHAVRAIGRLSSMAMLAGVSAKKGGSPTGNPSEDDLTNQLLESVEDEDRPQAKPTFSKVIKDVEVVEGSAARFDCKIEGYPDPEVVWYKDEQPIKETRHFQIDYDEDGNCSLVISEVSGDDDAKYTCKALNSLGEATCVAELIVEVMAEEEEEEEEEE
ncbi:myosin light chain kinase, smooth muscle [Conger conger]|uniref:myosin light chain kinase, smooth muscle n=1 Tax=Conger conger TaxID=82655 RepID=UPI002A5AE609|nr:myosin light chain kinase, smooth muscle [Conger conger]